MTLPRYSDVSLPPYRHRPGRTPHPTRDPEGHTHSRVTLPAARFRADRWHLCRAYLYGIDLFNHRYWWECHEVLEGCWLATGRSGPAAHVLQGLIQAAAALLQQERGITRAAKRLATLAVGHLAAGGERALGLDLVYLRREIAAAVDETGPATAPPVLRLYPMSPSDT